MMINDPLAPTLVWQKQPENVLLIKKLGKHLFEPFLDILKHLIYHHRLNVFVEESEYENEILKSDSKIRSAMQVVADQCSIRKFVKNSPHGNDKIEIDFIVCLGGDGTLLHASSLFQAACPPVLSIHGGSLGFLCPFDIENYKKYLSGVIKGGVPLLYRNRLKFKLEKSLDISQKFESSLCDTTNGNEQPISSEHYSSEFNLASLNRVSSSHSLNKDATSEIKLPHSHSLCQEYYKNKEDEESPSSIECLSLNEIIVSRGANSYLCNLDLYVNDYLITTVQGDGLISSTAYAMAAGASMCHPSVQSTIIAPICPHSLSFRPIVVPMGVELKICLNQDARRTAWCSVDGRMPNTQLQHGWNVVITASKYPVPFICRSDQVNEWFEGLAMCLHWNERPRQLPLNSCFMKSRSPSRSRSHSSFCSQSTSSSTYSSKQNLNSASSNQYLGSRNSLLGVPGVNYDADDVHVISEKFD